jgi:hypothetical protein
MPRCNAVCGWHVCCCGVAMARLLPPLTWSTLLAVALLGGCVVGEPVVDAPSPCECVDDRDCAPGAVCVADGDCGTCRAIVCVEDADCDVGAVCDVGRGRCEAPLACDSADPDLGCGPGEQCLVLDVQGCRAPPVGDTCALWPPSRAIPAGPLVVAAVGRAADGRLIPAGRATFDVSGAAVDQDLARAGGIDDADRTGLVATCAGPERCVVDVTAAVGMARCQARYTVLPTPASGAVQVIVVDEDLGGPLAGADIVVAAEGSVVTGVTDDVGVFVAPGIGAVVDRVTVGAPGFDGFSCLDCESTLELALPRRLSAEATPAIAGRVEVGDDGSGDLVFGLLGLPLTSPAFPAQQLWGVPGTIPFEIDGITGPGSRLPFASAAGLQLGTQPLREDVVAFGRPGGRTLWSFGARVSLASMGPLISGLAAADDDGPPQDLRLEALRRAGPAARSGLLGAVVPMPAPAPAARDTRLDELRGPGAAVVLADVDVAADVDVTLTGPLPPGTSDVLLLVGAVLPGEGVIPLGGAVVAATGASAPIRVPFSPPHDGLEGRALRLLAIAVDVDALVAADVLGSARVVAAIPAPGRDRTPAVILPAFPRPAAGSLRGSAFLIDDAGDDTPVLHLRGDGGPAHRVVVGPAAIGADGRVDLAGVFDDLAVDEDDVDLAIGTTSGAGGWDVPGRQTTPGH